MGEGGPRFWATAEERRTYTLVAVIIAAFLTSLAGLIALSWESPPGGGGKPVLFLSLGSNSSKAGVFQYNLSFVHESGTLSVQQIRFVAVDSSCASIQGLLNFTLIDPSSSATPWQAFAIENGSSQQWISGATEILPFYGYLLTFANHSLVGDTVRALGEPGGAVLASYHIGGGVGSCIG